MNKNTIKRIVAFAAAVAAFSVFGGEVAQDEAREAVKGWAALQEALTGKERFSADGVAKVETYQGRDGRGSFHVVSFKGGGFAVTSGDTEIAPILAYSEDGEFVAAALGDADPRCRRAHEEIGGEFFSHKEHKEHKGGRILWGQTLAEVQILVGLGWFFKGQLG